MQLTLRCPYCGHDNKIGVTEFSGRGMLFCNCEEGGCDNLFAYQWFVEPKVKVALVDFMEPPANVKQQPQPNSTAVA